MVAKDNVRIQTVYDHLTESEVADAINSLQGGLQNDGIQSVTSPAERG